MFSLEKSTQLRFQLFILLVKFGGLEGTCSRSRDSWYYLLGQGNRLHGYVIKEYEVKNVAECTYHCFKTQPSCKSFNYESGGEILPDKQRKSQLNNATKSSNPHGLIVAETFDYWKTQTDIVDSKENTSTTVTPSPTSQQTSATSCADLYKSGVRQDGEYSVDPDGEGSFQVLCDMTSDGGGWTIIQKRFDGSVDFNRSWADYKNGFGEFGSEFWLGLNKIHLLISNETNTLKIDLKSFATEYRRASYSPFGVGDETSNFILTAKNYVGNSGDSLKLHDGMMFTTRDRDNDHSGWQNCAEAFKGGWWFHDCHSSNLNGIYHNGQYLPEEGDRDGVVWEAWKGLQESLKETVMRIRTSNF